MPGLDEVGQDDGALDLAIWDADIGEYWGLVRLDAAEDGKWGHRRTGGGGFGGGSSRSYC